MDWLRPHLILMPMGLDPVILSGSGGCGGARIKSGQDEEGTDCLRQHLILVPMGPSLAMTWGKFGRSGQVQFSAPIQVTFRR
jgi:hypothetical protein